MSHRTSAGVSTRCTAATTQRAFGVLFTSVRSSEGPVQRLCCVLTELWEVSFYRKLWKFRAYIAVARQPCFDAFLTQGRGPRPGRLGNRLCTREALLQGPCKDVEGTRPEPLMHWVSVAECGSCYLLRSALYQQGTDYFVFWWTVLRLEGFTVTSWEHSIVHKLQQSRSCRGFKGIEQLALLALEKTGSHLGAYTSATA